MYAAISRSEATAARDRDLSRADGAIRLRLGADRARPLVGLYQRSPGRVLFPHAEAGEPPQAVIANTAGGLTGGDRWSAEIALDEGAAAVLATQAAEKLYRGLDAPTRVRTGLRLSPGAWLEWLPQETILFDGARLERRLEIDLAGDARLLAVEMLVFGRLAAGERLRQGALWDSWRVRRDGRLLWADSLRLEGDIAGSMARAACFGEARASALLLYAGADAPALLETARALIAGSGGRAGASSFRGLLLCRLLDAEPRRLRAALGRLVAGLRRAAAGLPARLPRVWSC